MRIDGNEIHTQLHEGLNCSPAERGEDSEKSQRRQEGYTNGCSERGAERVRDRTCSPYINPKVCFEKYSFSGTLSFHCGNGT